ncbi:PLP-dependent aminotransferase family protein [Paenibacillus lycopersici]|uniref:PLP-dependent aminotransferase family protein n=1 Tax=Paenibacillus lycopersici TaxID=2704462 RepID=A0A6C0G4U8_9BACL|nr:PLP-dependent aminotransferase family protein [Paenibacillus lycopersici]QHT62509.1 PLP-dependent aminotransferase family protein [Paenibacillus lycopersici]
MRGGSVIDLALTFDADEPLYRQLYSQIRTRIQDGVLKDGTKLPSIRSLGRQLGMSKTTIETAYHMLLEEGFVIGKERAGMIVVNPGAGRLKTAVPDARQEPAGESDAAAQAGGSGQGRAVRARPIDFSLLTIDGDAFPVRLWKSVVGESIAIHADSLHDYGDPQGEYAFRESLAHYLQQSRGVRCSPEQIVVGTGISSSLQLLARLLGERLAIGIEHPGIAQVGRIFRQNRLRLLPFAIPEGGGLAQELARHRIQALYVTPSHRPTGEPLPYAVRQQMLQWAYAHRSYIIEDDYDGELRLSGKPIPSLQGLDTGGAVIYLGSFSKVFTPALRMNYMVLPPRLAEGLHAIDPVFACPSRMNQWAMQLFMSRGHWYRHLRRMRKRYRVKRETLVELLRRHLPEAVRVGGSGSGLHLELSVSASAGAGRLIELARQAGVLVYGSQDEPARLDGGSPKIYLGFGGVKEEDMERGVRLLAEAWSSAYD